MNFVRGLFLRRKKTHAEISNILKQMYPGEKGFSEGTVGRFCLNNTIVRDRITTDELEEHVRTAVKQVSSGTINSVIINMDHLHYFPKCTKRKNSIHNYLGMSISLLQLGPTWGRKMIKGFLKSKRIDAGDRRVGKALSVVSPLYHVARCANVQRNINPLPYKADYFGHKLHIDQNEKLVTYGLTHVCASDGYSGKLVSLGETRYLTKLKLSLKETTNFRYI